MMHLKSVFYINMNEFDDKQSFFINKVYCICLNCLVALNTKFKKGKIFNKTMQKSYHGEMLVLFF